MGSLGSALTKRLLQLNPQSIRVLDNHEESLHQLQKTTEDNDVKLRFFVGDITDENRMDLACENVDLIFHTAALKRIEYGETNPSTYIRVNVGGTSNVINAGLKNNAEKIMIVSTDKACSPVNLYGSTKLQAEKLAISSNLTVGNKRTIVSCVRYGNVIGSTGSVIPIWRSQIENNEPITLTDPEMKRFSITMDDAVEFILQSTYKAAGGEIFIPNLKTYEVEDLMQAMICLTDREVKTKQIPIRQGEKKFEILISKDEMPHVRVDNDSYMILPPNDIIEEYDLGCKKYLKCQKPNMVEYTSENTPKLTHNELIEILRDKC